MPTHFLTKFSILIVLLSSLIVSKQILTQIFLRNIFVFWVERLWRNVPTFFMIVEFKYGTIDLIRQIKELLLGINDKKNWPLSQVWQLSRDSN